MGRRRAGDRARQRRQPLAAGAGLARGMVTLAIFELDVILASVTPDLAVGPWSVVPVSVAFNAGAPPESLWRIDLARDLAASQVALAQGERSVALTHAMLDDAPPRFNRALEYTLT